MMLSDICLSDICCVHPVGGRRVLADRTRLGQPGSRLPLCASVAGRPGGGISWPAYSLLLLQCFDTVGWRQEGHPACKKLDVGLLVVTILTGALCVL